MDPITDFFNNLILHGFSESYAQFPPLQSGHDLRTLGLADPASAKELHLRFARLSQLAYLDGGTARGFLGQHFPNVICEYFSEASCQCHILREREDVVIVFRGTEPTNFGDWMLNANFALVNASGIHIGLAGMVHKGISEGFKALRPQVEAWIMQQEAHPPQRYWISGHSLGGALATLCVAWLGSAKGTIAHRTITFGQPRVGNVDFATAFNTIHQPQFDRLVNQHDPVPAFPPALDLLAGAAAWLSLANINPHLPPPYRHVGNELVLPNHSVFVDLACHGLSNPAVLPHGYIEALA